MYLSARIDIYINIYTYSVYIYTHYRTCLAIYTVVYIFVLSIFSVRRKDIHRHQCNSR